MVTLQIFACNKISVRIYKLENKSYRIVINQSKSPKKVRNKKVNQNHSKDSSLWNKIFSGFIAKSNRKLPIFISFSSWNTVFNSSNKKKKKKNSEKKWKDYFAVEITHMHVNTTSCHKSNNLGEKIGKIILYGHALQ